LKGDKIGALLDEHPQSALPLPSQVICHTFVTIESVNTNTIKMKLTIVAALVASATAFTAPKVEVPAVSLISMICYGFLGSRNVDTLNVKILSH
jgi:hypothetical protein